MHILYIYLSTSILSLSRHLDLLALAVPVIAGRQEREDLRHVALHPGIGNLLRHPEGDGMQLVGQSFEESDDLAATSVVALTRPAVAFEEAGHLGDARSVIVHVGVQYTHVISSLSNGYGHSRAVEGEADLGARLVRCPRLLGGLCGGASVAKAAKSNLTTSYQRV
jgi:hypothetical protein